MLFLVKHNETHKTQDLPQFVIEFVICNCGNDYNITNWISSLPAHSNIQAEMNSDRKMFLFAHKYFNN